MTIDDERIDGVTLGKALARIFAAGRLVPGRIFSCFEKVVSVSALHLEVIRTALGGSLLMMDEWSVQPTGKHLMLLHDLSASAREEISDPVVREYLESLSKRGIQRKAANTLLSLSFPKPSAHRREVVLCVVQKRIERVKRWQAWLDGSS